MACLAALPQASPAVPSPADIEFRLRTARLLAELHGEAVLSEQQCAKHMRIDLVSWRKLEDCFSSGAHFIEGEDEELPSTSSEAVLRAALAALPQTEPALTEEQEREAFECAMKAKGYHKSSFFRGVSGDYTLTAPQLLWDGWKTRAALPQTEPTDDREAVQQAMNEASKRKIRLRDGPYDYAAPQTEPGAEQS